MSDDYIEILKNVERLPDNALVDRETGAVLLRRCARSLRRKSPVPWIKTGERTGGYRIRDIRAFLDREVIAA